MNGFANLFAQKLEKAQKEIKVLKKREKILIEALQKIYDPMKYHHWEEDAYTRAGCFQFVAQEALKQIDK